MFLFTRKNFCAGNAGKSEEKTRASWLKDTSRGLYKVLIYLLYNLENTAGKLDTWNIYKPYKQKLNFRKNPPVNDGFLRLTWINPSLNFVFTKFPDMC